MGIDMDTGARKRRIFHIIEATATGTLSMASLLANLQAAEGHEVTVVHSRRPETPADLRAHFCAPVRLTHVPMQTGRQKLAALGAIRRLVGTARPDVLFLHSSFAGFIGRLATLAMPRGLRVFYLPHCISFMRQDVPAAKRLLFVALEWLAAVRPATYVACSESERAEISRRIPFSHCVLVENAVEMKVQPRSPLSDRTRTRVTTIGQVRAQKDPVRFAEIAQRLRATGVPFDFVWIGDGDPAHKIELARAGVDVTGWLPKPSVMAQLRDSDIYLSTALWEGMPVALIEAQLCGVPVVASRCAGNADCINHGRTGWLYDSVEEAVSAIGLLAVDPQMAAAGAAAAAEMARTRFSEERYRAQMASLVE